MMSDEEKNVKNILRQKRKWLIILLCSIYCTFIFVLITAFLGNSPKTVFQVNLVGLSGIMIMLGGYLVIPILLFIFLYILIATRNIAMSNDKIIGEIPITFIVISLMVISFVTGVIFTK